MNLAIAITLLVLLALVMLSSYVERVYTEIGKFLSREFQDNIDNFEQLVEPRLKVSRSRAALAFAVLTPVLMAAIALLVGFSIFRNGDWSADEVLEGGLSLLLIVIIFNRFLPFVFFSRTDGKWLVPWIPLLRGLIYLILPVTLVLHASNAAKSASFKLAKHTDHRSMFRMLILRHESQISNQTGKRDVFDERVRRAR